MMHIALAHMQYVVILYNILILLSTNIKVMNTILKIFRICGTPLI